MKKAISVLLGLLLALSVTACSETNDEEMSIQPSEFSEETLEVLELFDDEIQFFENDLVDYLDVLANKGIKIIVSGLDQNFLRKPFGIIPSLMAIAENVTKLKAVCAICKNAAACSFRKNNNKDEIYIGNAEAYEARCRQCYYYGNKS